MITTAGLNKIAAAIVGTIATGAYTVGGVTKSTPIFTTKITGSTLEVHLYLDDSVSGTITKYQLKAGDGTVIIDKPDSVLKTATEGLLVIFKITIKET